MSLVSVESKVIVCSGLKKDLKDNYCIPYRRSSWEKIVTRCLIKWFKIVINDTFAVESCKKACWVKWENFNDVYPSSSFTSHSNKKAKEHHMPPVTEKVWSVTLVALVITGNEPKTNSVSKKSEVYMSLLHFRKSTSIIPRAKPSYRLQFKLSTFYQYKVTWDSELSLSRCH